MGTLFLEGCHTQTISLQIFCNTHKIQKKIVLDPKMTFESCRNRLEIAGSEIANVARE
jgi:hypothetical protein